MSNGKKLNRKQRRALRKQNRSKKHLQIEEGDSWMIERCKNDDPNNVVDIEARLSELKDELAVMLKPSFDEMEPHMPPWEKLDRTDPVHMAKAAYFNVQTLLSAIAHVVDNSTADNVALCLLRWLMDTMSEENVEWCSRIKRGLDNPLMIRKNQDGTAKTDLYAHVDAFDDSDVSGVDIPLRGWWNDPKFLLNGQEQ